MTYREYLNTCDEFERTIIISNLARKHPHYDCYSSKRKRDTIKELLDAEIPQAESEVENEHRKSLHSNIG